MMSTHDIERELGALLIVLILFVIHHAVLNSFFVPVCRGKLKHRAMDFTHGGMDGFVVVGCRDDLSM